MPVINATVPEQPSGIGMLLETVLNSAVAYGKGKQDKAYRLSAAKLLGVDPATLGHFQRDEIKNLVAEKFKAEQNTRYGEYKPKDEAAAIRLKQAEYGIKAESEMRSNYAKYITGVEKYGQTPQSFAEFKKRFNETVSPVTTTIPNNTTPIVSISNPASPASGGSSIGKTLLNLLQNTMPNTDAERMANIAGPIGVGLTKLFSKKQPVITTQPQGNTPVTGDILVDRQNAPIAPTPEVLPSGVTEEDIQHTLKLHPEYTRETLLKKLGV